MTILPKDEDRKDKKAVKKKTKTVKKKVVKKVVAKRPLTMNDKIRPWYMNAYPTDELGKEINPKATFMGAWMCLKEKKDIYDYLGVGDSIVRERVFGMIAKLKKCSYDFVYNMWLHGTKVKRK